MKKEKRERIKKEVEKVGKRKVKVICGAPIYVKGNRYSPDEIFECDEAVGKMLVNQGLCKWED